MNAATYLLARRYLWNSTKEHTLWVMIMISCMSIAIGSFSLTLVTSIMNGFEDAVHDKMQNIHPQATIYASAPIALHAVQDLITREFPAVRSLSPYGIHYVILDADQDTDSPDLCVLKAIDPLLEQQVSKLEEKVVVGKLAVDKNKIIIGKAMADTHEIHVGDRLTLYYFEGMSNAKNARIESAPAQVTGIFQTGIDEYDGSLIYCSHDYFNTLFPNRGITQIGLNFDPTANIPIICKQLETRTGFQVLTWQQLYPALVSALTLEKYAMFVILALISVVASMNIIALIFMLISYKKADIALLRAMGMGVGEIQNFFIMIGMSISSIAMLIGISGAWTISKLLEKYPFITLPDAYYVTHLPSKMSVAIASSVVLLVGFITLLACWGATRGIKSIKIAHILRFEG